MVLSLAYRTGAAWNESNWSNAEFDKTITEAEGYVDVDKRRAGMAKLGREMPADGPFAGPLWGPRFTNSARKIKGSK